MKRLRPIGQGPSREGQVTLQPYTAFEVSNKTNPAEYCSHCCNTKTYLSVCRNRFFPRSYDVLRRATAEIPMLPQRLRHRQQFVSLGTSAAQGDCFDTSAYYCSTDSPSLLLSCSGGLLCRFHTGRSNFES